VNAEPPGLPELTDAQWVALYQWLHDTPPPEPAPDPRPTTRLPDIATWENP
jgi:hypothetical protein